MKHLFEQICVLRCKHDSCLSAKADCDFKNLMMDIIEKDVFKNDYLNNTYLLLFEKVDYEKTKTGLMNIIRSGLFD